MAEYYYKAVRMDDTNTYKVWMNVKSIIVVVQSLTRVWLFEIPMDRSTPGFHVLHYHLELAQTHVHWISDPRERLLNDTNGRKCQPLPNIQVEPLCKPTQNCELLEVPQSIIFQGFVAKDSEVSQSERRVNNSD